jgi:hypothetical protein
MPNFARGFKRLTWAVSIVLAVPWIALGLGDISSAGLCFSIGAARFRPNVGRVLHRAVDYQGLFKPADG